MNNVKDEVTGGTNSEGFAAELALEAEQQRNEMQRKLNQQAIPDGMKLDFEDVDLGMFSFVELKEEGDMFIGHITGEKLESEEPSEITGHWCRDLKGNKYVLSHYYGVDKAIKEHGYSEVNVYKIVRGTKNDKVVNWRVSIAKPKS